MTVMTHRFKIGALNCAVVADGKSPIDRERLGKIMATVPTEDLDNALDGMGDVVSYFNCLLIQSEDTTLLVDSGLGTGAAPVGGNLLAALAVLEVQPEDIDIVFITHFHGDHINGLLTPEGARQFPNARYVTNAAEWDGWHTDEARQRLGDRWETMLKPVHAIQDDLERVEANAEIIPGVTVLPAYGHSPGHSGLDIESQGERFLFLVDIVHYIVQLEHLDWSPVFDSQPHLTPQTRRDLLGVAAESDVLTMLYHFPFPGLGKVSATEQGFSWTPVTE